MYKYRKYLYTYYYFIIIVTLKKFIDVDAGYMKCLTQVFQFRIPCQGHVFSGKISDRSEKNWQRNFRIS